VAARERQPIDVAEEMMHVTLDIVCKALFDIDINNKADAFGRSFMHVNTFLMEHFMRPFPPIIVPTGKNRRYQRALRDLNTIVADMLRERRREGRDHGDLLSMLLEARDEETGQGMDDQQLRDEIMTLLVAGHETVANALAWSWHLLATHEDVEQKLYAELERELAGRTPTVDDL
jgi:cytochrome P450